MYANNLSAAFLSHARQETKDYERTKIVSHRLQCCIRLRIYVGRYVYPVSCNLYINMILGWEIPQYVSCLRTDVS